MAEQLPLMGFSVNWPWGAVEHWPEWVSDEEGELVWVRHDLAATLTDEIEKYLGAGLDGAALTLPHYDLMAKEWRGGGVWEDWWWDLMPVHDDAQDACAYIRYEVAYSW